MKTNVNFWSLQQRRERIHSFSMTKKKRRIGTKFYLGTLQDPDCRLLAQKMLETRIEDYSQHFFLP